MFRMLLQEAFRWVIALTTLAGSGALVGTVPLFQEAAPALEFEVAEVEPPEEELLPEIVIESDEIGMSGLAFHPAIMYRGDDECHDVYILHGSLKNHGPGVATGVVLTYTMPAEWVEDIDLVLEKADDPLTTAAPLRFGLRVDTDDETWPDAGAEDRIQIPLTATATLAGESVTATAMAIIYNACSEKEPPVVDDPEEPEEPEGPDNGMGISGLVFHPGHLNAGGVCRPMYTARGSLKNHGPGTVLDVTLAYTIPERYEGVITVEVVNSSADQLTTSKPLRFTVNVHIEDMDAWQELGKGESITIQISAQSEGTEAATATMTVRNQCKGENGKVKGEDPGTEGKDWSSHPLGGPPGQVDKEQRSHPLGGPPGQGAGNKPSHPLDGPPGREGKGKPNK